jgi:toxin FitB
MYLLDTNVVSEIRKAGSGRENVNVVSWVRDKADELLYLSAITLFELELGALQVARRDPRQGQALRSWIDDGVRRAFRGRIIPADEIVALRAAAFNIPNPKPMHDAFIGATAAEHGLSIVTRNVRDFQGMGIEIINPWEATS